MQEGPEKATDYVASWIARNRKEIGGSDIGFIRQEEHGRTLCAEFETNEHLIQFCAWDHAYCLDVLALNKATGKDSYIVAGECDGIEGLHNRLEAFLYWLSINEPGRNA